VFSIEESQIIMQNNFLVTSGMLNVVEITYENDTHDYEDEYTEKYIDKAVNLDELLNEIENEFYHHHRMDKAYIDFGRSSENLYLNVDNTCSCNHCECPEVTKYYLKIQGANDQAIDELLELLRKKYTLSETKISDDPQLQDEMVNMLSDKYENSQDESSNSEI